MMSRTFDEKNLLFFSINENFAQRSSALPEMAEAVRPETVRGHHAGDVLPPTWT